MIGSLKRWLGRAKPIRSSKDGENLTDWEQDQIARTDKCPDCGDTLREGPSGGMSTNFLCLGCHSEFNLTYFEGGVHGERISDAGPRNIGDRAWAYGLEPSKQPS